MGQTRTVLGEARLVSVALGRLGIGIAHRRIQPQLVRTESVFIRGELLLARALGLPQLRRLALQLRHLLLQLRQPRIRFTTALAFRTKLRHLILLLISSRAQLAQLGFLLTKREIVLVDLALEALELAFGLLLPSAEGHERGHEQGHEQGHERGHERGHE